MRIVPSPPRPSDGPALERIDGYAAQVGDGEVRRLIPTSRRRRVGSWVFVDHFGPTEHAPADGVHGIAPHPHTCLATVTWLFEGATRHLDSLGSDQVIRPGQLNVMYAGSGIAHAEIEVEGNTRTHGVQLWLAQPGHTRLGAPAFHHHAELPRGSRDGVHHRVLMGSLDGQTSPARTDHPLLLAEVVLEAGGARPLSLRPDFEHAVLVVQGSATIAGESLPTGPLLYLGRGRSGLSLASDTGARLMLLGGLPLEEDIAMHWNFVGRTGEELADFRDRWNQGTLAGPVPGTALPKLSSP